MTSARQVSGHHRLPVSSRRVPILTALSGTQRARYQGNDHLDANYGRVPGRDDHSGYWALSTVVHASGCGPCCFTSCCTNLTLTRQANSVRLSPATPAPTGVRLFVPKPSTNVGCQSCGMLDLGTTVHRRSLASTVGGGDCYSLVSASAHAPRFGRRDHFLCRAYAVQKRAISPERRARCLDNPFPGRAGWASTTMLS